MNEVHFEQFARTLSSASKANFSRYGDEQYQLWVLATRPDFRGRGAGTRLCKWGMEKVKDKGYMVTVLGSPMGAALYKHLGFHLLETVVVQMENEEEKLLIECLEFSCSRT